MHYVAAVNEQHATAYMDVQISVPAKKVTVTSREAEVIDWVIPAMQDYAIETGDYTLDDIPELTHNTLTVPLVNYALEDLLWRLEQYVEMALESDGLSGVSTRGEATVARNLIRKITNINAT